MSGKADPSFAPTLHRAEARRIQFTRVVTCQSYSIKYVVVLELISIINYTAYIIIIGFLYKYYLKYTIYIIAKVLMNHIMYSYWYDK